MINVVVTKQMTRSSMPVSRNPASGTHIFATGVGATAVLASKSMLYHDNVGVDVNNTHPSMVNSLNKTHFLLRNLESRGKTVNYEPLRSFIL